MPTFTFQLFRNYTGTETASIDIQAETMAAARVKLAGFTDDDIDSEAYANDTDNGIEPEPWSVNDAEMPDSDQEEE